MAALKPSTKFARWISAHSQRIADDKSDEFKNHIATVSLLLNMIEQNPDGIAGVTQEYAVEKFKAFEAGVTKRGWPMPEIDLPKIKVVRPR